ncbi:hypothetical protein HBA55_08835 [Pseudomaricurvus alkylphenolicus]|uniref:hypothetical protein n=1 Tax=Pseudomaricurvus alkylphenolicus TaxID=1306991 RepID=UPI00141F00D7|nr:hypothetical protein [Pseudomaricurvus alkylphenolicus]NIB39689.1 hypothetical protein [Pseudomaricurvus alkylphenolicus]
MESKKPVEESASVPVDSSKNESRRKLIKKAGVVAPGLLILANRPAMAASCSISGFMSARVGTSLTTYDPGLCDGWSPGNWTQNVGQITDQAWALAGIARTTPFNSEFTTSGPNFSGGVIRRVVDGVPDAAAYDYDSMFAQTFQQILEGILPGQGSLKDITKHAAAALLNALFIQNGGGGGNPDPWMINYVSPEDVIGLYLLYELTFQDPTPQPANTTFVYERGGVVIASSEGMSSADYAAFFLSLANGSGSQAWQDGLP